MMRRKLIVTIIAFGLLFIATSVQAKGTARIEFDASQQVVVGETFTVTLRVTDVKDTSAGVVSLGGIISFDSDVVEYISAEEIDVPYQFWINEENYKIAGVDFTMQNGIFNSTTIYKFTFRAKSEGTTSITLKDARLTDCDDYFSVDVVGTEVQITEPTFEVMNDGGLEKEESEEFNYSIQEKEKQNAQNISNFISKNNTEKEITSVSGKEESQTTKKLTFVKEDQKDVSLEKITKQQELFVKRKALMDSIQRKFTGIFRKYFNVSLCKKQQTNIFLKTVLIKLRTN